MRPGCNERRVIAARPAEPGISTRAITLVINRQFELLVSVGATAGCEYHRPELYRHCLYQAWAAVYCSSRPVRSKMSVFATPESVSLVSEASLYPRRFAPSTTVS